MLQVTKTMLPGIENPYAVGWLNLNGTLWGVCASGSRGGSIAFPAGEPERCREQKLSMPNWGAQTFCQTDDNAYFAIQGFLPEFECEGACLVRIRAEGGDWIVEKCFDLPFLHKIAAVTVEDRHFLLCATLSGKKEYKEDWSRPGEVLLAPVPEDPVHGSWKFERLIGSMTKNHGFCRAVFHGRDTLFYSASEGVFAVTPPEKADGTWEVRRILQQEIGDLTVSGGDGILAAVDGFHGNRFSIYRENAEGGFAREMSVPLVWGHTAWAGRAGGIPVAVAGELNEKARILFFADFGEGYRLIYQEEGIGPFSVTPRVVDENTVELLCPARAAGRPLLYRIQRTEE